MAAQKTAFIAEDKAHRRRLNIAMILSCVVALACALGIAVWQLGRTLSVSSRSTTEGFTAMMDKYTHSFELYEQILRLEIDKAESADEISDYLKQNNETFAEIDGSDYDGVYLYYQGRYLYSWDTPYSVYENRGYIATERPWYTGAVDADGEIWFSVPYQSYANDYMLSTISRLQPDGETVIAYDIKLGAIQSFASELNLYQGSLTMLCDADGNIIGTTNSLYAGGNYLLTAGAYADQIAQARDELSNAAGAERDKAEKKLQSLEALQSFSAEDRTGILLAASSPNRVHFRLQSGKLSFFFGEGKYACITVVPVARLMPTVLLIWSVLTVIFLLSILLWENIRIRMQHVRELAETNRRLEETARRADAANVAKSQFLAQMSHEIRTPLNAVIGLTGIAETEVQSPQKVAEYLAKIENSSRMLLTILNDVLDMSAIEGGKLKIDAAKFNFRGMLTDLAAVFYEQTRQKGVQFEVRMKGVTAEELVGDELRVNQVLMNLLSNAVKFTPSGGKIDLTVLQASQSHGKVQLRFIVADTGCGMSEEMQGRLFRPFEQESAATARKHGGSGLGLSITKRLIEMMGGSIQVESTPGKGSVFTVDIPFTVEKNESSDSTADFSKIRALVVDDDRDSCEYTGVLLERMNVPNDYVTGGEAALETLNRAKNEGNPYNLCLIDWKMPEMAGGELTRKIRKSFGDDAVTIIVSAYDPGEAESSGSAAGANYFVAKPLFQSTLYNALMQISGSRLGALPRQKQTYDFTGRRVMVVEDVALNTEVAAQLLKMVGIEVVCAENGKRAVELFEQSQPGHFDCILMDVNMPVMDGYEATRAIRTSGRPDALDVPVYAMTANAFAEDVTAALNAGMNGHIAKPIETAVLYRTLETVFPHTEEETGAV